ADDTRATLAAVLFGQIPRPRSLRGDVPKDVERVVMKLLERDMPSRYATAEQALHDLLECVDTPKAGREVLMSTLQQRFPGQAPMRQSLLRSGNATPQQIGHAATVAPYQTPAQLGHANTRPAAALSLGAMMNAPTGTIDHRRRKGSTIALIVLAIAIASGAIALGVTVALKGGSRGSGSQVASTPPDAPAAPPPDASAPPDAAVVDAAPAPMDAAVVVAPKDPKKDAPRLAVAEKKYGSLRVSSYPITTVFVDGTKHGETTTTIRLTVGKHTVRVMNPDSQPPVDKSTSVVIEDNKTFPLHYPW
ncbi:MAG: hypothetical protein H0V17_13450, partial [Deltaproteobacteria bacterium]|nr:hypothetical protein [Deltaproteobacteria bacterium]